MYTGKNALHVTHAWHMCFTCVWHTCEWDEKCHTCDTHVVTRMFDMCVMHVTHACKFTHVSHMILSWNINWLQIRYLSDTVHTCKTHVIWHACDTCVACITMCHMRETCVTRMWNICVDTHVAHVLEITYVTHALHTCITCVISHACVTCVAFLP